MSIKVDSSGIEEICNNMYSITKRMKENITNIQNDNTTLANDWSGEASENYDNKLRALLNSFDEAYKELLYAILYMARTSEKYQGLEQEVIRNVCSDLNISEPNLNGSKIFSDFNGGDSHGF